jgi:hypothetical protein
MVQKWLCATAGLKPTKKSRPLSAPPAPMGRRKSGPHAEAVEVEAVEVEMVSRYQDAKEL